MKKIRFILIVMISFSAFSQQRLTLNECYSLVEINYPLVKQHQLLAQQNQLDKEIILNSKLPQIHLDAQATYLSEVIQIPIPNSTIEPLNNDQYRATFSVNQLIYNGGLTDATLKVKSGQLKTKQKQVDATIYQLKTQINQLYFSILLVQENYKLIEAKKNLLEIKLKEVQSGVKNGVLLPSSDSVLEAELLKIKQQFIEVESAKSSLIETLSSLVGQTLLSDIIFEKPLIQTQLQNEINRPELELFQLKKEEIKNYEMLISKQNSPQLNGFATGGYGNPGLNMLDNSFQTFYTLGLKLHWNVFDWNSNKKQQEAVAINKDIIENETEIFKLNTNIELNKQQKEIEKISAFINSDEAIIELRKKVLKTLDAQLKNGVVTASAYITEFTNLFEAENTMLKHQIQIQLAKANYNTIKGE
ncbi:TolC family protein [Polaribacter glomeratus]|uniref:Transporter n=1 Tax=Polaribacter glomeratus TaxID=102 RepID=A0A2S7WHT5_9FLAO|nr:TolC family protein [Polaribacter glomeratus]PQJ77168.1 transporter [Polaribacter glomeratus]TXD65184.1 TolC family protein [Polaribacter glomeratus]